MPAYLRKDRNEILSLALRKLERNSAITSTSPGSVARALTEAIVSEIGDMYDILEFNINQQLLSTATGSALDSLGALYDVRRKTVSTLTSIDRQTGSFYFYIDSPFASDIVIPKGTNIYTDTTSYIGQQFSYSTLEAAVIPAGRTRVFVSIKPNFTDSVFTAGTNTLIVHDMESPIGTLVYCTNPKTIQAQVGYEDDNGYRQRIIKQLKVATGGTLEAVRFAALAVTGVRDARIRQAPYGLGSFEIIVVPEDLQFMNQTMNAVSDAIDAVRPLGVRAFVKEPTTSSVDFQADLVLTGSNAASVVNSATQKAKVVVQQYINNLLPGETIVYNRLIQIILDSSELTRDVLVKRFAVAGTEVPRRNFQTKVDQYLYPGSVAIGVARA